MWLRGLAADVVRGKDVHAEKVRAREQAERAKARTLGVFLQEVFAPWCAQHQSRTTDTVRKVRTAFAALLANPMDSISPWWVENGELNVARQGSRLPR